MQPVAGRARPHVSRENGVLHLSFEIDFLAPTVAHWVSAPVAGGANCQEARLIMEMLSRSQLVSSLDIVELNPKLDLRGESANIIIDLVVVLFGRSKRVGEQCREVIA